MNMRVLAMALAASAVLVLIGGPAFADPPSGGDAASPAAATHARLACKDPAPQPSCQCLCAPTSTHAGGLIYTCQKKQWYCPAPAPPAPAKPTPPKP